MHCTAVMPFTTCQIYFSVVSQYFCCGDAGRERASLFSATLVARDLIFTKAPMTEAEECAMAGKDNDEDKFETVQEATEDEEDDAESGAGEKTAEKPSEEKGDAAEEDKEKPLEEKAKPKVKALAKAPGKTRARQADIASASGDVQPPPKRKKIEETPKGGAKGKKAVPESTNAETLPAEQKPKKGDQKPSKQGKVPQNRAAEGLVAEQKPFKPGKVPQINAGLFALTEAQDPPGGDEPPPEIFGADEEPDTRPTTRAQRYVFDTNRALLPSYVNERWRVLNDVGTQMRGKSKEKNAIINKYVRRDAAYTSRLIGCTDAKKGITRAKGLDIDDTRERGNRGLKKTIMIGKVFGETKSSSMRRWHQMNAGKTKKASGITKKKARRSKSQGLMESRAPSTSTSAMKMEQVSPQFSEAKKCSCSNATCHGHSKPDPPETCSRATRTQTWLRQQQAKSKSSSLTTPTSHCFKNVLMG